MKSAQCHVGVFVQAVMSNQQVEAVGTKIYYFEVPYRMILYFMQRHMQ